MAEILFFVFAGVALGGAAGVVLAKNPVGSLLFMVATLASLAGIFVLLLVPSLEQWVDPHVMGG
jgi:NADH:ubiquinone oxidoreductase subunit 6 (subunit J)